MKSFIELRTEDLILSSTTIKGKFRESYLLKTSFIFLNFKELAKFLWKNKLYLTVKMHKMSKDNSNWCKIKERTFMDLFWQWDLLKDFWDLIICFGNWVWHETFAYILFNDKPEYRLCEQKCRILITITNFAKKCILLLQKNESSPTFKPFLDQVTAIYNTVFFFRFDGSVFLYVCRVQVYIYCLSFLVCQFIVLDGKYLHFVRFVLIKGAEGSVDDTKGSMHVYLLVLVTVNKLTKQTVKKLIWLFSDFNPLTSQRCQKTGSSAN